MIYYQHQPTAPGKGFLKVAGILMILFGAATSGGLIFGIVGFIGLLDFPEQIVERISFLMTGYGIVGVLHLTAGIIGIKNCKKIDKAKTCFVWGIISAISALLGTLILLVIEDMYNWSSLAEIWGIYLFLLMPTVIYLIGAVRNRNEHNSQ